MIDADGYQNLSELQILEQKIARHLKLIEEHQRRVSDLVHIREQKGQKLQEGESLLTRMKEILQKDETEMERVESTIQKSRDRLRHIRQAGELDAHERELTTFMAKKKELELSILKLMDECDQLEQQIGEWKNFLQGSEKSLQEIGSEVENDVTQEKHKIQHYEKQMQQILDLLSAPVRSHFLRVDQKYRYRHPLATVENQNCSECHMAVNRNDQMQMEKSLHLMFCSGCGRILIPTLKS